MVSISWGQLQLGHHFVTLDIKSPQVLSMLLSAIPELQMGGQLTRTPAPEHRYHVDRSAVYGVYLQARS